MSKTDPRSKAPARSGLRCSAWLALLAAGLGAGVSAAAGARAQPLEAGDAAYAEPTEATESAETDPAAAVQPWAEGDTVRELLRADAQAARAAPPPRQAADWLGPRAGGAPRASGGPADAPHGSGAADRVDVVAIYGVGKALHADISVNGRVSRYRAGRAAPLASASPGDSYVLQAIDVPCVRLRKSGEPHTACLLSGHD